MAVQVYSIDQTYVAVFYPQVEVSTTASITPTSLVSLIETAASRVNGILLAHGLDPDDIAADTATETYSVTRGLVLACLRPLFDVALLVDPTESEGKCLERIEAFEALPQILGAGADGIGPRTTTSTEYLGITISDENRKRRRSFGRGFGGW